MSVTLESSLCPEASVLLEQYGEHIYCVLLANNIPILSTAYTRTLVSPILRKYTQLVEYSTIPSLYNAPLPSTPPSHSPDEPVYVLDLTSPPVYATYLKYKARYFPITCLYDNMTSLLECYTLDELLEKLRVDVFILTEERKGVVNRRDTLTGEVVDVDRSSIEACKYPFTYSHYWYTDNDHPEVVSLLSLLKEYPKMLTSPHIVQIAMSPFTEVIIGDVLWMVYIVDRLAAFKAANQDFMRLLVVREYYQLLKDTVDRDTFIPINHPLLGCSVVDNLYLTNCMSDIVGHWIENVDFSKCKMVGSLVTACLSCVSFGSSIAGIREYYPAASTTVRNNADIRHYVNTTSLVHKTIRRRPYFDLARKMSEVNGTVLTVEHYVGNGRTATVEFDVEAANPVQLVVDNEEDLEEVAKQVHSVYCASRGPTELTYLDDKKTWYITPSLERSLNGSRSVTICVQNYTSVLGNCMPLDRVYYDGNTIHCTPSCIAEVTHIATVKKPVLSHVLCHWLPGTNLPEEVSRYESLGYYPSDKDSNRVYNILNDCHESAVTTKTPLLDRSLVPKVQTLTDDHPSISLRYVKSELRELVSSVYTLAGRNY